MAWRMKHIGRDHHRLTGRHRMNTRVKGQATITFQNNMQFITGVAVAGGRPAATVIGCQAAPCQVWE